MEGRRLVLRIYRKKERKPKTKQKANLKKPREICRKKREADPFAAADTEGACLAANRNKHLGRIERGI